MNNKMNAKVDNYIQKQKSPQIEICRELRRIILTTFPNSKEEIRWGVPSYADGGFYIVALKDHVNLGFSIKGLSKDEIALFNGGGKTMRHIEIGRIQEIDERRIGKLLSMVKKSQ